MLPRIQRLRWRKVLVPIAVAAVLAVGALLFVKTQHPPTVAPSRTSQEDLPGPPMSPAAQAPVTVRWMGHWLGEDTRETLVREVARDFAFTHPGVKVNLKFPAEIMGEWSIARTAAFIAEQVRKPVPDWDVVWCEDKHYQQVAEILNDPEWGCKYLVNFSTRPGFLQAHKPFIGDDAYYRRQTGGILVGPYIEGYYLALWYNTDVAERMGIEVRERGMTWDDFLGYARRAHEARMAGETAYFLCETGDWFNSQYLFQSLTRSEFPEFARAVATGGDAAKLAAMRKGLAAFVELGRLDPMPPNHRELKWYEARRMPLEGKCLFYVGGTWMYSHWRGLDAKAMEKVRPCELPVFQATNHGLGGYMPTWAVLKNSPAREQAEALLMYWCRPDVADRWAAYTKNPTGLVGDLNRLRNAQDPYELFMLDMDSRYRARVRVFENPVYLLGSGGATLAGGIDGALRTLLEGRGDPEQIAEDLLRQAGGTP